MCYYDKIVYVVSFGPFGFATSTSEVSNMRQK